jgi:hypothetical protein
MVFNATFNNISVISWRSVLLVVEIKIHSGKSNYDTITITTMMVCDYFNTMQLLLEYICWVLVKVHRAQTHRAAHVPEVAVRVTLSMGVVRLFNTESLTTDHIGQQASI